jgi:hypothetical protein
MKVIIAIIKPQSIKVLAYFKLKVAVISKDNVDIKREQLCGTKPMWCK